MRIPKTLQSEGIEFETVRVGLYCSIIDHSVVPIRDQEKLERVWADLFRGQPPQTMPEVNFEQQMLIGVFRGQFPSTGFTTDIEWVVDARFRGGRFLWVVIAEHDPRGMTRPDFTAPYHIIKLPASRTLVRPFFYRSLV